MGGLFAIKKIVLVGLPGDVEALICDPPLAKGNRKMSL